ncbi:MAG TPA: nucleotidyltransferase family protein [Candidatus Acidoferrum sp.]|nr:nucleotidyltransferase family protein [Candidatus Acidoferrum sp.]
MITGAPCFLGVLILGAGASTRMGKPKLLLPWRDTTVIGSIIQQWKELGANQITVVSRPDDSSLTVELDRLQLPNTNRIINPDPARGMFSSIRCAAEWTGWLPTLTHWAVALGDQPHLANETLSALAYFARQEPERIFQPTSNGRARHPVFLPRRCFLALANSEHRTLKEFLVTHALQVQLLPVNDDGLDLDLDTPEDFQTVARHFGGMRI